MVAILSVRVIGRSTTLSGIERVGTAPTEGTANFLVNCRMKKSRRMRWSRRGADRRLQIRCAVYNGNLDTGLGQRFQLAHDHHSSLPIAA
jgi:hypothetical protein